MTGKSFRHSDSAGLDSSGTASDPTADIDDDWALGEDPAAAAEVRASAASAEPGASKSAPPSTEEIDSEWPDANRPSDAGLSSPSHPEPTDRPSRISDASIARFEAAAAALSSHDESFTVASTGHRSAQSQPPAARVETPAVKTSDRASKAQNDSDAREPTPARQKNSSARPASTEKTRGRAGVWLGLAAAAVVVTVIGFALRSGEDPKPRSERSQQALTPEPAQAKPAQPEPIAPSVSKPNQLETAVAARASSEPGEPSAAPDAASPDSAASKTVKVHLVPLDAQIYHKGKLLGTSGTAVEVPAGERLLLLVARDGYWPRKLILDGTESVVNLGLRERPPASGKAATAGAAPKTMSKTTSAAPAVEPQQPKPDP